MKIDSNTVLNNHFFQKKPNRTGELFEENGRSKNCTNLKLIYMLNAP